MIKAPALLKAPAREKLRPFWIVKLSETALVAKPARASAPVCSTRAAAPVPSRTEQQFALNSV
jgi:hypothetical protein